MNLATTLNMIDSALMGVGEVFRKLAGIPLGASLVVLLIVGAGFAVWANNIQISSVQIETPCGCGAPVREVGYWYAINWSATSVLFAPCAIVFLFAFSNAIQKALLEMQEDGILLDRETSEPVGYLQVQRWLNQTFLATGLIGCLAAALVAFNGIGYMNNTSIHYAQSDQVYETLLPYGSTSNVTVNPDLEAQVLSCPTVWSENASTLLEHHYPSSSPGDRNYPVADACRDERGEEIDWTVAHLFVPPPGDLSTAEWGEDITLFTKSITLYLLIFAASLILAGFLFAWRFVIWLWCIQLGQTKFRFITIERVEANDLPVLKALQPVSVFLGAATLAIMAAIYSFAVWNDYLRSLEHANFAAYLVEPFAAGFQAATEAQDILAFVGPFFSDSALAAAAFNGDRMLAIFLAIIAIPPSALLAAFVRARRRNGDPNQISFERGWRMLLVILTAAMLSLFFIKLGVYLIAGLLVVVLLRAAKVFLRPATD